jgi:hypothetical protein
MTLFCDNGDEPSVLSYRRVYLLHSDTVNFCRSWRLFGLTCRSEVAGLLGSLVRIPRIAWMLVSCVCCVLCRLAASATS